MWHEARKMEKSIYQQMNNTARKKELARRHYEATSKDPSTFLTIRGQKLRIHDDPSIATAASEANTMKKWQGDETVLIDRFDARNLIDTVPKKTGRFEIVPTTVDEYIEQMQVNYERYKELVAIAFTGEDDEQVLKSIEEKDLKLRTLKHDKKKKATTNKKASVGYNYDDSDEPVQSSKKQMLPPDSGSESSDDDELFSTKFGSIVFSTNDWERVNKIAEKFQIPRDAFAKLYDVDRGEEVDHAKISEIERERLMISGKAGKRARAKLRQHKSQILKDPLNEDSVACLRRFAERRMRKYGDESESSSDDNNSEKIRIASYAISDNETKKKSNHDVKIKKDHNSIDFQRINELKNRRSNSPFGESWEARNSSNYMSRLRSASRSMSPVAEEKERPLFKRRRAEDRHNKSVSPMPSSSHGTKYQSPSHFKSSSDERKTTSSGWLRSRLTNLKKSTENNDTQNSTFVREDSLSPMSTSGDEEEPLSMRSSLSESEMERREIENRKRRIRKTKRELRRRVKVPKPQEGDGSDSEKKAIAAKKLREKLQENISKTRRELKTEELAKQAQIEEDIKRRHDEEGTRSKHTIRKSPHRSHSSASDDSVYQRRHYRDSHERRARSRSPRRRSRSRSRRSRSRSPSRNRRSSPTRRHTYSRSSYRDRSRSRSPRHRHHKHDSHRDSRHYRRRSRSRS